jgi:uncharacterized protein
MQARFAAALLGQGGPPGMDVYRGNVFGNWAQALAGAYPIVCKIVGEEFFRRLARAYAREHPSASGDLNEYGEHLADFVSRFPQTLDLPYLPDVARMEWLAHRAYCAQDPVPFELHGLDGSSCLRLTPPCALLASEWPLARIWTVHQDDYQGAFDIDLRSGPDRIVVHRPGWRVQVRSLAPGDYCFLSMIREGKTLGETLEAALAKEGAFDVSLALARWVDAGVVAR